MAQIYGPSIGLDQISFRFALSMIQQFESTNGSSSSNFVISPYCLHSGLTMLIPGTEAEAFNELITALGYLNLTIEQYNLINSTYQELFRQFSDEKALRPISVLTTIMQIGKPKLPVDYSEGNNRKCFNLDYIPDTTKRSGDVLGTVNKWFSNRTRTGSLKKWVEIPPTRSVHYLLNSASFRALWAPIDDSLNGRCFWNADGTQFRPKWMTRSQRYRINSLPQEKVFFLSNSELAIQMALFLPNEELYDRTKSFAKILEPYKDDFRLFLTGNTAGRNDISMPKLRLSGYFSAKRMFESLGVKGIFQEDGLRTPTGNRMFFSEALCSYEIELRETEVKSGSNSSSRRQKLVIDRPFMTIVFHNQTKIPLLMNVVNKL